MPQLPLTMSTCHQYSRPLHRRTRSPAMNLTWYIYLLNDTYLLIGSNNIGTAVEEFGNIQSWAASNDLHISSNKTKELIIFLWCSKSVTYPAEPLIPGAERVTPLRVVISSHLTMEEHLDQLISSCASSIFALRTLRAHGLRPPQLHHVARATTVASLLSRPGSFWDNETSRNE